MPPQITFIKTGHGNYIPVKVIVRKTNKLNSQEGNEVSINSQSIVRLHKPLPNFQVRLSNNYLKEIIDKNCQGHLRSILCDAPIDLQKAFVTVKMNADKAKVPSMGAQPHVIIVIPVHLILAYRLSIGKLLLEEEQGMLDRAAKTNTHCNYLKLLERRTKGVKKGPQIGIENDDDMHLLDEDFADKDHKNGVLFKLVTRPLLNNFASCIKIYVLDRR